MASDTVRINVVFPADVAEELRDLVPPRQRSRFVAEAVEAELRRLRQRTAIRESAGAWRADDHPGLEDGAAIDRWVAEGRRDLGWDDDAEVDAGDARTSP